MISLPAALDDPKLFGSWFKGPSWNAWRAVLKPAFGAAMSDDELELFRSVAERDPPRNRVRELWIIGGRRAGKDSVASAIAAWAAAGTDYRAMLRPGEQASVLCLACDRQQARIVLRYTRAYFAQNDMLGRLVTGETADGLTLSTRAELMVATNSFRSIRGRTIACVILDECAFWRDEQSASPDVETYNAIVPGLATIPGSMMIGISSPYRRGGLLYQKWKDHYGKADDDVLVIRAPSRTLNPTLDPRIIDEALARDPAVARAEWLAEWRDDIATFLSRELIESAVDLGVTLAAAGRRRLISRVLRPVGGHQRFVHLRDCACRGRDRGPGLPARDPGSVQSRDRNGRRCEDAEELRAGRGCRRSVRGELGY